MSTRVLDCSVHMKAKCVFDKESNHLGAHMCFYGCTGCSFVVGISVNIASLAYVCICIRMYTVGNCSSRKAQNALSTHCMSSTQ